MAEGSEASWLRDLKPRADPSLSQEWLRDLNQQVKEKEHMRAIEHAKSAAAATHEDVMLRASAAEAESRLRQQLQLSSK